MCVCDAGPGPAARLATDIGHEMGCSAARGEAVLEREDELSPAAIRWGELGISSAAPLPQGSLLYSTVRDASGEPDDAGLTPVSGALYMTTAPYDGVGPPPCAWLRRKTRSRKGESTLFLLEQGVSTRSRGSYADASGGPWLPDLETLWLAN